MTGKSDTAGQQREKEPNLGQKEARQDQKSDAELRRMGEEFEKPSEKPSEKRGAGDKNKDEGR
jgi:hypothetical protein